MFNARTHSSQINSVFPPKVLILTFNIAVEKLENVSFLLQFFSVLENLYIYPMEYDYIHHHLSPLTPSTDPQTHPSANFMYLFKTLFSCPFCQKGSYTLCAHRLILQFCSCKFFWHSVHQWVCFHSLSHCISLLLYFSLASFYFCMQYVFWIVHCPVFKLFWSKSQVSKSLRLFWV